MNVEDLTVLALILSSLALFISLVTALKFKRWQNIYEASTQDSKRPFDKKLVEHWKRRYDALPKHSVKWRAYRKRLIEVGVNIDGN